LLVYNKDVLPGQENCERHLHRGCPHSRKPVEASQTAAASDKGAPPALA